MIDNQFEARQLGRHGLKAGPGFMGALDNEQIDLVVMDNFVDLVAKHTRFGDQDQVGYFIRRGALGHLPAECTMDAKYLNIAESVRNFKKISNWILEKQPQATLVFLNFPFQHNKNQMVVDRTVAFEELFAHKKVKTLPLVHVPASMIVTAPHFSNEFYSMIAGFIHSKLNKALRKDIAESAAADDMLWQSELASRPAI